MSRTAKAARRKARKEKSGGALREARRQRKINRQRAEVERDRAERQKWQDCVYHGVELQPGDIYYAVGEEESLSLMPLKHGSPIMEIYCGKCEQGWIWYSPYRTHP